MKTLVILIIIFTSLLSSVFSQDSTKVQIVFQTNSNQPIKLFQKVYLGEVNTEGWVGNHYAVQQGSLTKDEFLFNAPNTGYFDKNATVHLVMTDDHTYKLNFMVYPASKNQKWLLSPPGTDYIKSLKEMSWGGGGILVSSLLLITAAIVHVVEINSYHNNLDMYNFQKTNHFPDIGTAPTRPSVGALYILPAMSFAVSIPLFTHGYHLYNTNKPTATQIEY